jgi:dihydrofolate synthase/folylpolyglutamate synthase
MEGIRYLESLAQWKGRGGFGLEKLRSVMSALGNPQDKVKSVHIAGTNGKGSVSAMVSAILGADGQRVLLNTSPHLVRVNERIVVDGAPIPDHELDSLMVRIRAESEAVGQELSHFEGITAAAFLAAVKLEVDTMVVEVGLGGRLDATNIIEKPEVCAITSIGFDHEAILGDTLAKIAVEKAGIVKPNCLVVIGKMPEAAQWEIVSKARSVGANCLVYGEDFGVEAVGSGIVRFTSKEFGNFEMRPALAGPHQSSNIGVAVAIGRLLNAGEEQVRSGIQSVKWPGRLEFCSFKGSEILLEIGRAHV